jgi:hypothetical protein
MENSERRTDSAWKKIEWFYFMPVTVPAGWTEQQDIEGYVDKWGESDDYLRDTRVRFEKNLSYLDQVMDAAMDYCLEKRESHRAIPLSASTLREKVQSRTDLLPVTANRDYTLRFTVNLARILWLDSERERIRKLDQQSENPVWLFPFYELGDAILDAASELEETMECEHDDFEPTE